MINTMKAMTNQDKGISLNMGVADQARINS